MAHLGSQSSRGFLAAGIHGTQRARRRSVKVYKWKKIDPVLLEAAIRVFGNEALAMHWLMTQASVLADKRPVDATVEDALDLLARLEHGLGA